MVFLAVGFSFSFFSGLFNLWDIWMLCSFADDERLSCMKLEPECAIIFLKDASVSVDNKGRRYDEWMQKLQRND